VGRTEDLICPKCDLPFCDCECFQVGNDLSWENDNNAS
jgi:hypothetical protein